MSLSDRVAALRTTLVANEWDAIVVTSPANRRYLTGYTAGDDAADETAGVALITMDSAWLLVSPTNYPLAASDVPPDLIDLIAWEPPWPVDIASRLNAEGANIVAIEDATTTAATWFAIQQAVQSTVRLVAAGDAVDRLRAIKSDQEIALLSEAARCTDVAFLQAIAQFQPGMTEVQAAGIIRRALEDTGSEGEAFGTIVASGPNAAKPHHHPGSRAFVEGEPIIIDMGARIDGYNGDLSRTVCLGKPDERLVRMYEAVLAAQRAALDAVRHGVAIGAPDIAARAVFEERNQEAYVLHSVGHGLGLRVHEAPAVSRRSGGTLESGNVITIEPGLYVPDWGGVRIEDVAVVNHDGHRNATAAPKGVTHMSL